MGKTTDAFIVKIDSLSEECSKKVAPFSTALIKAKRLHTSISEQEQIMTQRHKELINATAMSTASEKAVTQDPAYKRAEAQFDVLNKQFENVCMDELDPARQALRQGLNQLEKSLSEFDAYVKAKEKAWFGSKNSVPTAKAAIAKGREYAGTLRQLSQVAT